MKNIIMTAVRPTGKLHLGHYVGALKKQVELQNKYQYDEMFLMIADAQALTDNFDNPQKIRDNVMEVMLDYLSIGFDPQKITFCLQSQILALPEMTQYFMNLVSLPRLLRNPTVKTEINQKGFDKSGVPVGFACYPISQAADICAFKANLIPVGIDQEPMLEQTREIVRAFNRTYKTDVLVECKSMLASNQESMRLPGTDGSAKMSKSIGNCIYLSDEPEEIKKKVNSIKTAPRKLEEPGEVENSVLFIYLRAICTDEHFEKYYPEYKNLKALETAYQKGGIGDGRVKKFLLDVLLDILTPIREKRKQLENHIPEILDILKKGTQKANDFANNTMEEMKRAMGIDYFSNNSFVSEQTEKHKK
jgi:tryptophanyl-tRNA synthetase